MMIIALTERILYVVGRLKWLDFEEVQRYVIGPYSRGGWAFNLQCVDRPPTMRIILSLLFVALLAIGAQAANDATLIPEAKGAEVVEMTVDKIEASCIFPEDKLLLRRLAYVESNDGVHPDTFRKGYFGGIWQVRKHFWLLVLNYWFRIKDKQHSEMDT